MLLSYGFDRCLQVLFVISAAFIGGVSLFVQSRKHRLLDKAVPLGIAPESHENISILCLVGIDRDKLTMLVS